MAAERYSFEVLQIFYGPIAEQENAGLSQPLAESEAIRNLPPELQEMILKEYIYLWAGIRCIGILKRRPSAKIEHKLFTSCFAVNAALAAGMGSVICVTKMESNTISAISSITDLFPTTTKSLRNFAEEQRY